MADALLSQSLGGPKKNKKKRTVIVVKKFEARSPKKEVFISRKIKNGETLEESFMGNSSAQKPIKQDSGDMMNRSILGDPKTFSMYEESSESVGNNEAQSNDVQYSGLTGSRAASRSGTRSPSRKTIARSNSAATDINNNNPREAKRNKKVAMATDSQNYIDSLVKLKTKALKIRAKEQEKEKNLLQYIPVNERFDLNKEGKVLAMWQERQKKWDQIQKGLSNKVGVRESNLLMTTGDDFRTRNEEYDLLQAAIPVHERFGSDSWQMQLRGGTGKAVSIGHIFSGLTCNVSVKRSTPATLRKPKKSRGPLKTTQFIDEFPSMKLRQKQLKKTLKTLRPHNLETFDVDSLVIGARDLFDWAIASSEDYMSEVQNDAEEICAESESLGLGMDGDILAEGDKDAFLQEEEGPQLRFESTRNILFEALQNETSKATVSFVNSGTTLMEYTWKKIDMNPDSELMEGFNKRKNIPRERELSEKRPVFFCSCRRGQILPGQRINTVFLFNSKGCGGYFNEAWMLDTSPRAIVLYPNRLVRTISMDHPGARAPETRVTSAQPMPAAVYVKLKGHARTLDESQHRRDEYLKLIKEGCVRTGVADEIYNTVRNVRKPITVDELSNRKMNLFKDMNFAAISAACACFKSKTDIHLSLKRFDLFMRLASKVSSFSEKVYSIESKRIVEAESDATPSERMCLNSPNALLALRERLLPEGSISLFDEISEDMLTFTWDFDLVTLSSEMERVADSCEIIKELEKTIEMNRVAAEKKRISAERRAADSDYESDEDEDEEDEEGEDEDENSSPKVEHPLVSFSQELKNELRKLYFSLSMHPLPSVEDQLRCAIGVAVDGYENIRATVIDSLEQKGKYEPPPTPNPFSEEGVSFWDDVLNSPTDPAEIAKRAKDKDPKRKFFFGMHKAVSNALVTNVVEQLASMNGDLQVNVDKATICNVSMMDPMGVAALRVEDVEKNPPTSPVFVGFDGDCFAAEPMKSALNLTHLEQRLAVTPILATAAAGAKKIILVHESSSPLFYDSINSVGKLIQEVLTAEDAKIAERNKPATASVNTYSVVTCATIPDLIYKLKISSGSGGSGEGVVQVFYLDNLLADGIVPMRSEYVEELSDDEDAPIPIGLEEHRAKKKSDWVGEGYVAVEAIVTSSKKQHTVTCYTDAGMAIRDLFEQENSSHVWIEANPSALLATPALSLFKAERILSSRLREMVLWVHIMQSMSGASAILTPLLEEERMDTSLFDSEEENEQEMELMTFSRHFGTLFPPSKTLSPSFVATIGGKLKPEKMKLLESLIDLASTIFVCGEVCIPFIACMRGVQFSKYSDMCSDYSSLCGMILQKVKMRGIEFVLPVDFIIGDEALTPDHLQLCFLNVDESACDEGADYDGESSVVSVSVPSQDQAQNPVVIRDFIYDIGPASCESLSSTVSSSHLHLSWGSIGCSEMSSFQAGQRALVTAASPPVSAEEIATSATTTSSQPPTEPHFPHNIVIGEANVEWWSRISDPEGEFGGHLTKMGVADFVSRHSKPVCSLLGNDSSHSLTYALRRPANNNEWDYLTSLRHEDDEEEEDDEDEDEDEED